MEKDLVGAKTGQVRGNGRSHEKQLWGQKLSPPKTSNRSQHHNKLDMGHIERFMLPSDFLRFDLGRLIR